MNDIELSYKDGEIAILKKNIEELKNDISVLSEDNGGLFIEKHKLKSSIDRAVEYIRDSYFITPPDKVDLIKILTEVDCKIVETKSQTKAKRSSK
jgi:hypothetical protein